MKRFLILLLAGFLLMGCVTSKQLKDSTTPKEVKFDGYKPSVNVFDNKSWIKYEPIELFQDDEYLIFQLKYISESFGKFSLFNPPNGNKLMVQGDLDNGSCQIIEKVSKKDLTGIEGITILLFPGDFSNELERKGFFFKSSEIKWDLIPYLQDSLISGLEEKIENGKSQPEVKVTKEKVGVNKKLTKDELILKVNDIDIETDGKERIIELFGNPDSKYLGDEFMVSFEGDDKIEELRFHIPEYTTKEGIVIGIYIIIT